WWPAPPLRPVSANAPPDHLPARRSAGSARAGPHAGFPPPWSCFAFRIPVRSTAAVLDSCSGSRFLNDARWRVQGISLAYGLIVKKYFSCCVSLPMMKNNIKETNSMSLPLAGLKVLDLTRALSGPFSTMILADLGAEVIKVEPTPDGDMVRQWGPFDEDISVYYLSANRNKKGIGVDFRSPEGLALIRQMALKSDIVVENFKVGTMESMGLGYEELAREHPELIMASISGFGRKGPAKSWAGFDQIAQGYSGFMSLTGTVESGPTRVGTAIGDLTAGMWVVIGILAAVVERKSTGRGQHVETSLLAGLMGLLSVQGQRYLSVGEVPQP